MKQPLYLFSIQTLILIYCLVIQPTEALFLSSPLILSMGKSGRAITQAEVEHHLLNPAGLIFAQTTQLSGFYVLEDIPYWGTSLSDNTTFPLAFTLIQNWDSTKQLIVVSSAGFILSGFSVGLSVYRWEEKGENTWNLQTGILIQPAGQNRFSIGATWDNILTGEGVFKEQQHLGMGIAYKIHKKIHLRTDLIYNIKNRWWKLTGGIETIFNNFLNIRIATQWNTTQKTFNYSGGVGLEGEKIQVDYSISQNKTKQLIHGFSMTIKF